MKKWFFWALMTTGTVAVGVYILARTPLAGAFGLNQKAPTQIL